MTRATAAIEADLRHAELATPAVRHEAADRMADLEARLAALLEFTRKLQRQIGGTR